MSPITSLAERYRAIVAYVAAIFALTGGLLLTPLIALVRWPAERTVAPCFAAPALLAIVAGTAVWRLMRPRHPVALTLRDGGIIVVLSWIAACLLSSWPLMGAEGLTFSQAVFEAVSGWSTTGLSVVDVTQASHTVLLWRSIMQLAGGAGLAIIMLASITGPVGAGLPAAEGRAEQLAPHVRESVKLVLTIYLSYALAGVLAYWVAGMSPFDAVNHAFAAVSTGGFSTRAESIGYWDSAAIEAVTVALMIAGSLNYLTALLLFHGRGRLAARNGEVRLVSLVVPVCVAVLLATLPAAGYVPPTKAVRVAVFEVLTALTSTGFSTTSYAHWPGLPVLVLIVLMFIGGGTCSTAGGVKQFRVYLLWRSVAWSVRRAFLPARAVVENYIWQDDRKDFVTDARLRDVGVVMAIYAFAVVLGAAIMCGYGHDVREALFESASAVGTCGLSMGVTSPDAPAGILWTETAQMFLGRLEFLVVVVSVGHLARDAWALIRSK